MLLIPDLPQTIEMERKRFRKRKPGHFSFFSKSQGEFLMVHGSESGKLLVPDEDLSIMLPFLNHIICCYPRRVCEVYERIFPGISSKIVHKWADIPTCFGLFSQKNGLITMAVLDYNPSNKEWQLVADNIERNMIK